ncbi:MAG: HAD family phosphatase [Pseudomonadales bacterium]
MSRLDTDNEIATSRRVAFCSTCSTTWCSKLAELDGHARGRLAAVVFDMDGLLLDSERLARELFFATCVEIGMQVDPAVYDRCVGTTHEGTAQILSAILGAAGYEELEARWSARYEARIRAHPVPVKAGALALLEYLQSTSVPLALATSTRRPVAERKLQLAGLAAFFPVMVCGGETPRGKPHPDPYLAALEHLGQPPARCLALEDSDNGVRAAHAAGLKVIQVPDLLEPAPAVRALGHQVVSDLHAVLADLRSGPTLAG